jgi:hypothetical protein
MLRRRRCWAACARSGVVRHAFPVHTRQCSVADGGTLYFCWVAREVSSATGATVKRYGTCESSRRLVSAEHHEVPLVRPAQRACAQGHGEAGPECRARRQTKGWAPCNNCAFYSAAWNPEGAGSSTRQPSTWPRHHRRHGLVHRLRAARAPRQYASTWRGWARNLTRCPAAAAGRLTHATRRRCDR